MNIMKLFLKEEKIRIGIKVFVALGFVLSIFLIWNALQIQEQIQEHKVVIKRFEDLTEELKGLSELTTDSIVRTTDSLARAKVFPNWLEVAKWIEENRKLSTQNIIEYHYEVMPLIAHPQGHKMTQELNVNYNLIFPQQDFTSLLTFLQASIQDTTKNLFIKELTVSADSLGIKNSTLQLGGWLRP